MRASLPWEPLPILSSHLAINEINVYLCETFEIPLPFGVTRMGPGVPPDRLFPHIVSGCFACPMCPLFEHVCMDSMYSPNNPYPFLPLYPSRFAPTAMHGSNAF